MPYWDELRNNIAMTMLPTISTMKLTKGEASRMISVEAAARLAKEYADALVEELKKV